MNKTFVLLHHDKMQMICVMHFQNKEISPIEGRYVLKLIMMSIYACIKSREEVRITFTIPD